MFSLMSKIVDFVIGNSDVDDPSTDQVTSSSSPRDNTTDDLSSLQYMPFLITPTENVKTRAVDGKVTHVFHGHGFIDGDVYFSMSSVQGNDKLQIGDSVHFKAVQHHENGAWYAEEITITNRIWKTQTKEEVNEIDLDVLKNAAVVGKITSLNNGTGKIDKEIDFDVYDCKDGFNPIRGDWVTASVEEYEEQIEQKDIVDEWDTRGPIQKKRAVNIHPLRRKHVEGVITAVMTGHGFIDGEIFFVHSACLNGYKARKMDNVKCLAIESTQGKCDWRAVSIVPKSKESIASRIQQQRHSAKQGGDSWLVPGQRPKSFQAKVILPMKLPHYTVPESLKDAVLEGEELTDTSPYLMQELTLDNYISRFSTLLSLEEIQYQLDIKEFDMNRVCLQPAGEFLALTVPGLAEGRPSVLIGDKIILSIPSDPGGPSYEGYVHEMTSTDVHLKFNPEFHCRYNGEDYNVEFTFSRTPLRRCHQAVALAVKHSGPKVLFPTQIEMKSPQVKLEDVMPSEDFLYSPKTNGNSTNTTQTNNGQQQDSQAHSSPNGTLYSSQDVRRLGQTSIPVNKQLNRSNTPSSESQSLSQTYNNHSKDYRKSSKLQERKGQKKGIQYFNPHLNERQKAAIVKILLGQARPVPYVIFGPPGTGKTITVVEAILQVLTQIPSSRIIACTPSNSAADLIAERIHLSGAVDQTQMVRLNAYQRSVDSIPECILKYCRFADDLQVISRYRLIVGTCTMAGALYGLGLSAGHVTHVFVDECGQATEPECLIPVGLASGSDGQIVLAGDPKQLGPIVMSPFAKMYGLELSFLERLMLREPYQRNEELFDDHGGFDSMLVTMLVNNYRSHPAILDLPSSLFYYSQLQPFADPKLTHTLAKWDLLPASGFPVVFHGIRGVDIREANSPSWFNPGETIQVVQYLQGVLKEGVEPDDIGIITPYRKQVEKIRLMMNRLNMPYVKVGSVEEFQGQERQVIIISTVRANEKLVGFDIRHTLGFLSNPKRFNVSITRAQALLILTGNPYVLAQDPNWRTLIKYCADNGGYTGCDLPDLSAYEDKEIEELNNKEEENLQEERNGCQRQETKPEK